MRILLCKARDAGQVLTQEVNSLSARLSSTTLGRDKATCIISAQSLAKEVGVLSDVRTPPTIHCILPAVFLMCRFNPELCLSGCGQHPHPSVAAQRAAGSTPSPAEEQQHYRQKTGDHRGLRSPVPRVDTIIGTQVKLCHIFL